MKKRIFQTASLSMAVLFAAVPMSFAQATSPATKPADALKPAADVAPVSAASPAAATTMTSAAAQPSADEMQKMMAQMMELGKPGENHKLLAELVGSWTYTLKMYMDPTTGKPSESKGTAVRKAIFDGRYFVADVTGKFQMPGKDGKMTDVNFKGMAVEGYDNVKKKFVSSWIDNMSTLIMNSEGTYDAASKTFTYNADCEMMPGMKMKIREVVKVVDKDHHTFEWYEDKGQGESKTMEISYTRSGKK